MQDTLLTLNLQGNKLIGSVPTRLFEMAIYIDYPLSTLNVGDNLLSGKVPTHVTINGYAYKLTDHFSELWLLGNNWEGGPCVALCGGINAGSLDVKKRESTIEWARKCVEDTQWHRYLDDSDYSIDELGRCSFKARYCGMAQLYSSSRTIVDPDCQQCPVNTFQTRSGLEMGDRTRPTRVAIGHRNTECFPQPTCDAGQYISTDNDLRNEIRTCTACPNNTYQSAEKHRLTECIDQPTCTSGQYITKDFQTVRRVCEPCPTGFYQSKSNHRETECIEQRTCSAGFEFTTTSDADRTCNACNDNEYQDVSDANALQTICIEQTQGEPIVSECDAGYYYNPNPETPDAIAADIDGCYPCSPGQFASRTARRVECDECPTATVEKDTRRFPDMLQTSEPASTSSSDCFAKFQTAPADQQFCFGEGSITSDNGNVDAKPLSRITSITTVSNPVFNEVAGGAIAKSNSSSSSSSSTPHQPKPSTNERCKKCSALKKFCTCDLRRNTMDMAGQKRKPKQDPTSGNTTCVQATSTGPCQKTPVPGTTLCADHTCKYQGCKSSKSSKASFCKKHAKTATITDEYLDIAGSNAAGIDL
eukprot:gene7260-20963_t